MEDKRKLEDKRTADLFIESMKVLASVWPIWGFRCSSQPYITNKDEIERELGRRKERHGGM